MTEKTSRTCSLNNLLNHSNNMSEIHSQINKNNLIVHPPGTMSLLKLKKLKTIKKLKNQKHKKIILKNKKNSLNSSGWKLRFVFFLLISEKNSPTSNKPTQDPGWFHDDTETRSEYKETAVSVDSCLWILNIRDANLSIHPLGTKPIIKLKNHKNTKKSIKHQNHKKITINIQTKKLINTKKSTKNQNHKKITIYN